MDIVTLSVYAVLGLTGGALAMLAVFGLRALSFGKIKPLTIVMIAVPFVLLLALGFAMGDWPVAAIYTVLIMLGLTILSLMLSSAKTLIS